jgi:ribosomal protein S26
MDVTEFEKLFYGSGGKSRDKNIDDVIMKNRVRVDLVHDVGDDAIYRNYSLGPKI